MAARFHIHTTRRAYRSGLPTSRAIYPPGTQRPVHLATAEAISWLVTQGLLVPILGSHRPGFYAPTRRAQNLRTRVDVEVFRKGRILPDELLPTLFAEKVVPLFRRGDHDIAVLQAFKEVEVAVRKAANTIGAGYPDSEVGIQLMRKAFHPDTGPLTDKNLIPTEREAEMHLFAGAIGHARLHPAIAIFRSPLERPRALSFSPAIFSILSNGALHPLGALQRLDERFPVEFPRQQAVRSIPAFALLGPLRRWSVSRCSPMHARMLRKSWAAWAAGGRAGLVATTARFVMDFHLEVTVSI